MTHDVVVIGAGIVGCATAAFLAHRGCRVAVFDAGPIGAGASGRNAGLVEHPYELHQHGLYEETVTLLKETLGSDMPAEPVGALLLFDDEPSAERAVRDKQRHPGLAPQLKTPDEVAALEPGVRAGHWGCLARTGYPIHPASAVQRFADLARARGATIVADTPVAPLWEGGVVRGVAVEGEAHRCDVVLVAAGAASSGVVDPTARWQPVSPLWGVSLTLSSDVVPSRPVLDGAVAAIQSGERTSAGGDLAFSLIPTPKQLALGSTFLAEKPDGKDWVDRLLANAGRFWEPAGAATVDDIRVCPRPRAFDDRPLLGRVAGHRTLWMASGHGGRGISTGVASARLVADAIVADSDRDIPQALRAERAGRPPAG